MKANEKPGLLEQDRADGNKHDQILTPNQDSVKANWLEDFRVRHGHKGTEIVEAIRLLFPGFDKALLSKCLKPEKYGIRLTPEAMSAIIDHLGTRPEGTCDADPANPKEPR